MPLRGNFYEKKMAGHLMENLPVARGCRLSYKAV
jgi:hypothetical protein